jgi:predicted DNA binding protein
MVKNMENRLHYGMFGGFYDSNWEIQHENCLMTSLADRLGLTLNVHLQLAAMKNRKINATFAIPHALKKNEVMDAFNGDVFNKVITASVEVDDAQDVTVFNITFEDSAMEWLVDVPGLLLQTYKATPKAEVVNLWAPSVNVVENVRDGLNKIGKGTILSMKRVERDDIVSKELLSPEQNHVLMALLDNGFWALPRRGITLKEIAPKLGTSDTTLSLTVREIAAKIFEDYTKKIAKIP